MGKNSNRQAGSCNRDRVRIEAPKIVMPCMQQFLACEVHRAYPPVVGLPMSFVPCIRPTISTGRELASLAFRSFREMDDVEESRMSLRLLSASCSVISLL